MCVSRATAGIIKEAEEQGILKLGMEIIGSAIDCSCVAMAYVAADRGYDLTLTVSETMSCENRKILAALGANLILTSAKEGNNAAIKKAEEIASAEPQRCFLAGIFESTITTAPDEKIRNASGGRINVTVSADVFSSGRIRGASRYTQHIKGRQLYS